MTRVFFLMQVSLILEWASVRSCMQMQILPFFSLSVLCGTVTQIDTDVVSEIICLSNEQHVSLHPLLLVGG